MITPERLKERAEALYAWERAGGRTGRLVWLDEQVRTGRRTDWAGRPPGREVRTTEAPGDAGQAGQAGQEGARGWR